MVVHYKKYLVGFIDVYFHEAVVGSVVISLDDKDGSIVSYELYAERKR